MSNGGEVKSRISLDNKGFLKSVKEVTNSLKGVKNSASTVLSGIGSATGTAFKVVGGAVVGATGAFAGLVTASVKARGEIEQSFGGIEALFGNEEDLINQVKDTGQKAYKDMQMSANDYYNSFLAGYSLINASLNDEQKSIEQTNRLLQIEADLMNTYGGTTEQYATAINWALKGTYSYLDNLNIGITGTKEGFLDAAKSCGYLVESVDDLTAEQKIDVISQYADRVGALGRSAQEASGTIQGSIKTLGASWNNFLSGAGDFGSVVESASVAMGNIIKVVREALPHIVSGITDNLPALLDLVIGIIKEVVNVILGNYEMILNAVLKLLIAVTKIIIDNLPMIIDATFKILMAIVDALANNSYMIGEAIGKLTGMILVKLTDPEFIAQLLRAVWEIGKGLVTGIWNGISAYWSTLWNNLKANLKNLLGKVKGFLGIHSPSTVFADMGKNMALGIGEGFNDEIQGVFDDMKPELTVGIDKVNNAVQGAGVVGGTKTQNNTFNINNGLDMGVAMQELNWLYRRM